ncbi:RNA polymerase sigma factor [Sorangium sp. So ce1151]|uniref:RNA polymerase sigma factor n=1 Tax=Sorangium sp. So ce1151 TaxID=3133332 RepID=UPI003F63CCA9
MGALRAGEGTAGGAQGEGREQRPTGRTGRRNLRVRAVAGRDLESGQHVGQRFLVAREAAHRVTRLAGSSIAVHQARKYHEKAYRRRKVTVVDPLAYVVGRVPSPHGQVEARALLELLWLVEPRERWVLVLVGEGEQVSEVARSLGMPIGTAFSRLRRGRKRLVAVLKRRRRMR